MQDVVRKKLHERFKEKPIDTIAISKEIHIMKEFRSAARSMDEYGVS